MPKWPKWVFGIRVFVPFCWVLHNFWAGFIPNYCIPGHVTEPATECPWVVWGAICRWQMMGHFDWFCCWMFFFSWGMFLNVFFAIAQIKRACVKYKLYMLAAWCCDVGNAKTSSTSYKVTRIWPPWRNANSLGLGRTAVRSTCPTPQQKNLWRQRQGFLKLNT